MLSIYNIFIIINFNFYENFVYSFYPITYIYMIFKLIKISKYIYLIYLRLIKKIYNFHIDFILILLIILFVKRKCIKNVLINYYEYNYL